MRRNLLRRMVSMLANSYEREAKLLDGTHKSHVHSPIEAQLLASYKPKINVSELRHKLKLEEVKTTQALQYFNTTRQMIIYYKDLIANRAETLLKVQEFLGLPSRNLTSRQVKIHRGALANQVENWEEIKSELSGTSYASFIRALIMENEGILCKCRCENVNTNIGHAYLASFPLDRQHRFQLCSYIRETCTLTS